MITIEEKVNHLDQALEEFIHQTNFSINTLTREMLDFKNETKDFKDEMLDFKNEMKDFKDEMLDFKNEMKDFKDEMLDFKNEMKDFKDEMLDFKNEMKDFKDEMLDFKNEMKDFKDEMLDFKNEMKDFKDEMKNFKEEMLDFKNEMKDFKDEMRLQTKELNKRWGDLANKMGTLVEDIIAPGAPEALNKKFGIEIVDLMVRRRVKDKSNNTEEFDVIIEGNDEKIYLIEVKSSPVIPNIKEVIDKAKKLKSLLYPDHEVVPIIGSLYFPETVIRHASQMKVYAIGMKGDYLEILN